MFHQTFPQEISFLLKIKVHNLPQSKNFRNSHKFPRTTDNVCVSAPFSMSELLIKHLTSWAALASNSKSSWPSWRWWVTILLLTILGMVYNPIIGQWVIILMMVDGLPWVGGWQTLGWWITLLGMVFDHLGDHFGTIIGEISDQILEGW